MKSTINTTETAMIQMTVPSEIWEQQQSRTIIRSRVASYCDHAPVLRGAEVEYIAGDVWDVRVYDERLDDAERDELHRDMLDSVL